MLWMPQWLDNLVSDMAKQHGKKLDLAFFTREIVNGNPKAY